jgi:hypothetical protein
MKKITFWIDVFEDKLLPIWQWLTPKLLMIFPQCRAIKIWVFTLGYLFIEVDT